MEGVRMRGTEDPLDLIYEPEPFCEHIKKQGLGFVYFIGPQEARALKIGWAYKVPERLCDLQTGNHAELFIYVAVPARPHAERELHRVFAKERLRGEWFEVTDRIVAAVQALRTRGKKIIQDRDWPAKLALLVKGTPPQAAP